MTLLPQRVSLNSTVFTEKSCKSFLYPTKVSQNQSKALGVFYLTAYKSWEAAWSVGMDFKQRVAVVLAATHPDGACSCSCSP